MEVFILAGQSNMSGRGVIESVDQVPLEGIFVLNQSGEVVPAIDPLHYDEPKKAGVGLGRSFAAGYREFHPESEILLVPTAFAGSPIESWRPGVRDPYAKRNLYDDALARAEAAATHGTIRGILWHQGEAEFNYGRAPYYEDRLRTLIAQFRNDLGQPSLPFVIGQLGTWLIAREQDYPLILASQKAVAADDASVAWVSSEGLVAGPDGVHFDAPSLREFGLRYAYAFAQLEGIEAARLERPRFIPWLSSLLAADLSGGALELTAGPPEGALQPQVDGLRTESVIPAVWTVSVPTAGAMLYQVRPGTPAP